MQRLGRLKLRGSQRVLVVRCRLRGRTRWYAPPRRGRTASKEQKAAKSARARLAFTPSSWVQHTAWVHHTVSAADIIACARLQLKRAQIEHACT